MSSARFAGSPSTRQRLLDAANLRFRADGYGATATATIAADAGVTERTFFRYFPTKADVLVANWVGYGERLRETLDDPGCDGRIADLVAEAATAFVAGVAEEIESGLGSVRTLFGDHAAFVAIIEHLLGVEDSLAVGIGRRLGRNGDDFAVRLAANAAMGVVRAAIRGAVADPTGPDALALLEQGLSVIRPVLDQLDD